MNTPALNPTIPIGIKVFTDLLVGGLVRNSNPAVQAARAATVNVIAQAFVQAGAGDVTDAMTAIDAAIANAIAAKTADPAIAAAAVTVIAWIASKAVTFQQFLSGTAAGALTGLILTQVGDEAIAVSAKYLTPSPAPAPAAAAK